MKSILCSGGVLHHEIHFQLWWCTTPWNIFLGPVVYTTKFIFSFGGVHPDIHFLVRWCTRPWNSFSGPVVYTTKFIFSFGGVHHEIHFLVQWCTTAWNSFSGPVVPYTTKSIFRSGRGLEKGYRGTARYEKAGRQARRKVVSKDMWWVVGKRGVPQFFRK